MTAPQAVARCPALSSARQRRRRSRGARRAPRRRFTLSPAIEDTAPGICTIDLRGSAREKFEPAAHAASPSSLASRFPRRRPRAHAAARPLPPRAPPIPSSSSPTKKTFLAPLPSRPPIPRLSSQTFSRIGACARSAISPRCRVTKSSGVSAPRASRSGNAPPAATRVRCARSCRRRHFPPRWNSKTRIATLEPLLFILRRFLDRLALELTTSQHIAAEIELALRPRRRNATHAQFPPARAHGRIRKFFFARCTRHFESLTTAASIIALDLRLIPTRPLVRQQGLSKPACAIHTVSPRPRARPPRSSDLIAWAPAAPKTLIVSTP